MNKLISEAVDWICELKNKLPSPLPAEVVVIPPFTVLRSIYDRLDGLPVALGAQNMHMEPSGSFTGEISYNMLRDAGCNYVLIGHSERRSLFGETDSIVNSKIRATSGLNVIFCLGETSEQRKKGLTEETIQRQLVEGLQGLSAIAAENITVAYEPVWAIGTGENASPAQAQEIHRLIRDWLAKKFGAGTSRKIRILYGGSVKTNNSVELLAEKDIDGLLVGGASLNAGTFCAIIKSAGGAFLREM